MLYVTRHGELEMSSILENLTLHFRLEHPAEAARARQ